jgi:hypothetical protein
MKVLKAKNFDLYRQLVEFVANNSVQREDIQTITHATGLGYTLFYYGVN